VPGLTEGFHPQPLRKQKIYHQPAINL